ncbi:hypothetical protein EW026_g3581 [Hermanssonia centrifuga]|uniref:Uncharacterized protein n=1 Tax=Hermanssonia centrifuga TaxID=98765 RepID=A0A4V3XAR5_9APHY|nr:hypothetical protein EW026_g3581 [Hermanssonia centrifuga]
MAQSNGTTVKNLNDSRAEALHAILNSLSPAAPGNHSEPANLRADQVRKLSDKLGEILGDEVESGDGTRRNENGELVNEEGLPIIDINEPVTAADFAFQPDPSGIFDDPDLLPLWVLSDAERARRKAERERLLDLLEEEEHIQHTRDSEAARERWREEMEKRKEASKTEMENLKRARELQKKMGRALLRNVVESREKADLEKVEQAKADEESATRRISLKPKKSVSFAEDTEDADNEQSGSEKGKGVEWGDVAPGRLRPKEQSPLSNQDRLDRQTMKMHVVERHPNAARPPTPPAPERDSDDESVLGSADSDEGHVVHSDPESEDDEHINTPDSDYDDSEDGLPPDEELTDWGNEDFDYARHQREIALEYYEKRKIIGAEVSGAMRAHTHDGHEWDQPVSHLIHISALPMSHLFAHRKFR